MGSRKNNTRIFRRAFVQVRVSEIRFESEIPVVFRNADLGKRPLVLRKSFVRESIAGHRAGWLLTMPDTATRNGNPSCRNSKNADEGHGLTGFENAHRNLLPECRPIAPPTSYGARRLTRSDTPLTSGQEEDILLWKF